MKKGKITENTTRGDDFMVVPSPREILLSSTWARAFSALVELTDNIHALQDLLPLHKACKAEVFHQVEMGTK